VAFLEILQKVVVSRRTVDFCRQSYFSNLQQIVGFSKLVKKVWLIASLHFARILKLDFCWNRMKLERVIVYLGIADLLLNVHSLMRERMAGVVQHSGQLLDTTYMYVAPDP